MAQIAALNAKQIFDFDKFHIGQYFYLTAVPDPIKGGKTGVYAVDCTTYFPNSTIADVNATLNAFLDGVRAIGANVTTRLLAELSINDGLTHQDDDVGETVVLGSRLLPARVYRDRPEAIGKMYDELLVGDGTGNS